MATALHNGPAEAGGGIHAGLYPRSFLNEFDVQDNRYPSLPSRSPRQNIPQHTPSPSGDIPPYDYQSNNDDQSPSMRHSDQMDDVPLRTPEMRPEPRNQEPVPSRRSAREPDTLSAQFLPSQSQDTQSYPSQEEMPRREPERRNSPQDNALSASVNRDTRPMSYPESSRSNVPQALRLDGGDRPLSMLPNTPRHPDVALASASSASGAGQFAPIMPLSASPNYTPPVAPRNRTYPQQPTYINPGKVSKPTYTPVAPPQEEVCLECAMRDQDMADVDVTSPGVWERASDVLFEELKEREREEEAAGIVSSDEKRPRARGGRLTEQNLKLWLSINPREPASRMQTLNTYVRSQRAMLEAEAVAHAKAMKEAAQLDNRMRDTYSQLRRSAYDLGTSSSPADDAGGVRIKPPQTPTTPVHHSHTRSHSREVTLLENGMIVEHVDVRREEREARERRRKEEKRARKSSRSSVFDVTSIISAQSTGLTVDNTLKPRSALSHTGARPVSELAPHDRPDLPRAYSQASFSDVHSLGSGSSPRRPKFFGMRNLSTGWRSQDSLAHSFAPSGMSGSMVDMHVALQREDKRRTIISPNASSRLSAFWPNGDQSDPVSEEKAKKKKSGLIKWWRTVTGSNKPDSQNRNPPVEDDLPLAPPPPLSYLVDRVLPSAEVWAVHHRTITYGTFSPIT
ncbi:hypothetical protein EST38_g4552 [Candolleomyces aberdarensis]|uniref:Uncharacterized protein n=1 Tax=Candolleomyces aberdarensis TaxID=2316362 RepID=A0A4Q2DQN2_9AGAR|nr:hypothetical protein EST38_g4552 [Candolleomyces aberdarensis]